MSELPYPKNWPRLLFLFIVVPLALNIALYILAFAFAPAFITDTGRLIEMREDLVRLNFVRILAFSGPTIFVLIRLLWPSQNTIGRLPQETAAAVTVAWLLASSLDMLLASRSMELPQIYWAERLGESLLFGSMALLAILETGLLCLAYYRSEHPLQFQDRITLQRALRSNYYSAALILLGLAFAGLNVRWLIESPPRVILPGFLVLLVAFIVQHQNQRMGPLLRTLEDLRSKAEQGSSTRVRILREIGHDVRTPLSSVLGAADLMLQKPRSEEDLKWLELIRSSTSQAAAALDLAAGQSAQDILHAPAPSRLLRGRVLIVEDHPVTLIVLERMLQHLGMEPVTTASLSQARRAMLQPEGFQAILMDLDLPDGDGRDLSREIRTRDAKIPILAITAAVLNDERASCLAVGMNDFLPKPVSLHTLETKLLEHLRAYG